MKFFTANELLNDNYIISVQISDRATTPLGS